MNNKNFDLEKFNKEYEENILKNATYCSTCIYQGSHSSWCNGCNKKNLKFSNLKEYKERIKEFEKFYESISNY